MKLHWVVDELKRLRNPGVQRVMAPAVVFYINFSCCMKNVEQIKWCHTLRDNPATLVCDVLENYDFCKTGHRHVRLPLIVSSVCMCFKNSNKLVSPCIVLTNR